MIRIGSKFVFKCVYRYKGVNIVPTFIKGMAYLKLRGITFLNQLINKTVLQQAIYKATIKTYILYNCTFIQIVHFHIY